MSIIIGNWNDTLPAAPAGYDNINFQINRGVSPPNISANVKKPIYQDGTRAMEGALGPKVVTLSDAETIAVNAALGNHFRVTLGGNRTLGNPTNAYDGQILRFEIKQDAEGSRTLDLDSKICVPSNLPELTLSTGAGVTDMIQLIYNSTEDKFFVTGLLTNLYEVA